VSVEERYAFWKGRADLRLGKRHLEILLAAWRAAQPAIEAAAAVLNASHQERLQARLREAPIPPGEMALYHPAHREAVDLCIGRDAAIVREAFEEVLEHICTALTTPAQPQDEGDPDGEFRPAA
jgi:hypothetical protein